MNYIIKLINLTTVLAFLSGCAMMDEDVELNYQTTPPAANALTTKTKTPIQVTSISDRRGDNPRAVVHKRNQYNQITSGTYLAEQNISDTVQNALINGLQDVGYKTGSSHSPYILTGTINSIDEENIMGFFTGTVVIKSDVNLKLTNRNGYTVWSDNLVGHGRVTTAGWIDNAIVKAFDASINDIVHQLEESPSFYKTLNKS